VGRSYPFGAYLHLLKASIEVSLTLWSTPYFPRTTTSFDTIREASEGRLAERRSLVLTRQRTWKP
jgi:hypothetical protein